MEIEHIFRIHVLGIGNYFSKRHRTTSFVVQTGEEFILVEAPNQIQKRLEDYKTAVKEKHPGWPADVPCLENIVVENTPRIIVTHDHNDHSAGVQNIGLYMKTDPYIQKLVGPKTKPSLYTSADVLLSLKNSNTEQFNFNGFDFSSFFDVVVADPVSSPVVDMGDGVTLEVKSTDHGIPGFAFVMSYSGRSLAYSSDTRFSDNLMDFLRQADTIIHECDGTLAVHTAPYQLVDWQKRASYGGKLYVTHFKDEDVPGSYGLTPLPEMDYIDV